jgi:hypothetical protein
MTEKNSRVAFFEEFTKSLEGDLGDKLQKNMVNLYAKKAIKDDLESRGSETLFSAVSEILFPDALQTECNNTKVTILDCIAKSKDAKKPEGK